MKEGHGHCAAHALTGNAEADWLAIRKLLAECGCKRLAEVAEEARNVRVLDRGTFLREQLSLDWRANGAYSNALSIVRQAFVQEHFSTSVRKESGVIVMNMHKAKGKQFDEVIIFEGWPRYAKNEIVGNPHRIVRGNTDGEHMTHARYNFRVSVTRARSKTNNSDTAAGCMHSPCSGSASGKSGSAMMSCLFVSSGPTQGLLLASMTLSRTSSTLIFPGGVLDCASCLSPSIAGRLL